MNDLEIEDLLQSYNRQLEESKILNLQSWVLNIQCFETLQRQKAKLQLGSLVNFKIYAVCLGILWILFLGNLFFLFSKNAKHFFPGVMRVNHVVDIISNHCLSTSRHPSQGY